MTAARSDARLHAPDPMLSFERLGRLLERSSPQSVAIMSSYFAGVPLREIESASDLSRERVRQIIGPLNRANLRMRRVA